MFKSTIVWKTMTMSIFTTISINFLVLALVLPSPSLSTNDHRVRPTLSSSSSTSSTTISTECRSQLSNCTDRVHPYLNDPRYMFPTNLNDVNEMCKMWSQFVDCTRRFISNCFEENRRLLFHKSVENSIDTVHAICSSKVYQNEYLAKANCFRQVSMDHCGVTYQQLTENIANLNSHDEHICCSYTQFKKCVNRPLLEECGRKAKNLMDHSMSFLISRCDYYSHSKQKECPQPSQITKSQKYGTPKIAINVGEVDQSKNANLIYELATTTTTTPASSSSTNQNLGTGRQNVLPSGGTSTMQSPKPSTIQSLTTSTTINKPSRPPEPDLIVYTMKPPQFHASKLFGGGGGGGGDASSDNGSNGDTSKTTKPSWLALILILVVILNISS